MSFGLSGAPSTFHKAMTTTLRPLLGKDVLVYLDDIVVMVATFGVVKGSFYFVSKWLV